MNILKNFMSTRQATGFVIRGLQCLGIFLVVLPILANATKAEVKLDGEIKPTNKKAVFKISPRSVKAAIRTTEIDIALGPPDLSEVLKEDAIKSEGKSVKRIGILRPLPNPLLVSSKQTSKGEWANLSNGGNIWILTIQSEEAEAIRIHIEEAHLPEGTQFIVYNTDDPQESYGPYDVESFRGGTEFWTESVFSSLVTIECYVPQGVDYGEVQFQIRKIAHVYMKSSDTMIKVGDCHNDVGCYSDWSNEANGVAYMTTVVSSAVYQCTGSLLNDHDSETFEDYFLTANHCLSLNSTDLGTQAVANTIEFYWFYQTPSCDGTPPNLATVPRTGGGADLISAQTAADGNDHCFLRIRKESPGGVFYEGWTTGTPGGIDPPTLTGIHHPSGSFKRISFGNRDDSSTDYWDIRWYSGVTEPGSSGSPLFDPDHRVMGQLWGGASSCSDLMGIDSYGRFNITYPNIERWLWIGGTIQVDGSYMGTELGTPNQPFNTVGEANDFAWNGARINIQAGSYPEALIFSKELTIMATGGTVTIGD